MRPLSQNASDFYRWLSELEAARSRETEGKFRRYGAALQAHLVACDDLLATGGTLKAGRALLERLGARVLGGVVLVDLPALAGARALGLPVLSALAY